VFATSVTELEKFNDVDFCHFTTLPVLPDKPNVVEFVPLHTVADPEVTAIVPATEVGSTVMVNAALVSFEHTPDATIAL